MLKKIVLISSVLVLAACGENSKIEDAVRQQLKDPGSAQFKEATISASGLRACVVWNAKNSMGGYGDWSVAELTKAESGWNAHEMKGREGNCTEVGFRAVEASVLADAAAREKVIATLQRVKSVSRDAAETLVRRECSGALVVYAVTAKMLAEAKVRATGTDRLVAQQAKQDLALEAGNCDF